MVPKTQNYKLSFRLLLFYAGCLGIFIGLISVGYYTLLRFGLQLVWHTLPNLIQTNLDQDFPNFAWILTTLGGFLVGITVHYLGASSGMAGVVEEIHVKGHIDSQHIPGTTIASLLSLIFGSSVGPEAPLVDINGGISSLLALRLRLNVEQVRILTFCGMGAALGAFFGSPLGSALFALEVPHRFGLEYYEAFVPVVISAIMGFIVFRVITGLTIGGQLEFPDYGKLYSQDILYAILLGVIGAGVAVFFLFIFRKTAQLTNSIHIHPILLTTLGGLVIGIAGFFVPLSLFYGEEQIQIIIDHGAQMGVWLLLMTAIVKVCTVSLSLNMGFKGGFIFPVFFIGADLGMMISLIFPAIHPTVAMICLMAALTVALLKNPVSIILILSVISDTDLIPLVSVAAITSLLLTIPIGMISTQQARSK